MKINIESKVESQKSKGESQKSKGESQKSKETIVRIIGELDTVAVTEQADVLQQVLNIANESLVIDCTSLEYISSAGLRFFMQLKRESEAQNGTIRITNLNEDVADIFRMSGFQNIFEIE